jgi:probable HAF family extracellular repeat protein
MPRHLFLILLAVSCLCSPLATAHAASYTFTTLTVPDSITTVAGGINTAGQIVGRFRDATAGIGHGFLTADGTTFTTIDVPGAAQTTEANGINDRGQIVGLFRDAAGGFHGFLKDGAAITTIDVPGATETTQAYGINAAGQIVGWFNDGTRPHGFLATPQMIVVTIDIKPGETPNAINPKSQGVIPVAILTTDTFDATLVNAATVRFGNTGARAAIVRSAREDVDGDGDTDLLLQFNTQDTGIQCGATSASLTGETADRQPIQGSDAIVTTGCKK